MIHCRRLIKHIYIFLFLLLPLMVFGAIVLAIVIGLNMTPRYQLPFWCRWFDCVDEFTGRDTSVYRSVCDKGKWARYTWLAFRNPINYFNYMIMGLHWTGRETYSTYYATNHNIGDGSNPGYRYIEIDQSGWTYFEYYYIYKYPFAPKYCLRYRMGWKIKDMTNAPDSVSQWVLVFNPFMPFTGK